MNEGERNLEYFQIKTDYDHKLNRILEGIENGSWSRLGFKLQLSDQFTGKFLNPQQQGCIEIGSWNSKWESPSNLTDKTDLIRLSTGVCDVNDSKFKLERIEVFANILNDCQAKFYCDKVRLYIVMSKEDFLNTISLLTLNEKNKIKSLRKEDE